MATRTSITCRRRARKRGKQGQSRKRKIRSRGTTPPFAIHPENKKSAAKS